MKGARAPGVDVVDHQGWPSLFIGRRLGRQHRKSVPGEVVGLDFSTQTELELVARRRKRAFQAECAPQAVEPQQIEAVALHRRPVGPGSRDDLERDPFVVDPNVPNGCDTAEEADYVVFESNRFRTPYVAVKVRPSLELNLEEEQVGFQLLRRLVDLQTDVDALDPEDPAHPIKLGDLQRGESFLEYLIELQTAYGISNFF